MVSPGCLKKGDKVTIVATARKVSAEEMRPAVALLKSWGLEVVLPEGLYGAERQFAGSDEERAGMLQWALDEKEVRAVFCARGGYGTVRIIDRIDFKGFAECPKWVVGYSDVTVLHSHLNRVVGSETIHGTMPINVPGDATERVYAATETLRRVLMGEAAEYEVRGHELNRKGEASGELVGGNLSMLYSMCGSASDIETEGKILMIEDLDEYLYHIDRMMQNLKRTGKLSGLKGLIAGGLTDMHDNTIPFGKTAEEIVREAVEEYGYPVCFGAPFGHIGVENCAVVLGRETRLEVADEGAKIIQEKGVGRCC